MQRVGEGGRPGWAGFIPAWALTCGLAALLWLAPLAAGRAQGPSAVPEPAVPETPADVAGGWNPPTESFAAEIPDAPNDFVTERRGNVRWDFPRVAQGEMDDLARTYDDAWPRIVDQLGGHVEGGMHVRIARSPEEMARLAPRHAPPPAYAVGVAYPRYGVILLTLTAPDSWERPAMSSVFTHELSHVALYRAVQGNPIPRWFGEGVATVQAGEVSFERHELLLRAAFGKTLIPLDALSGNFPNRPYEVNLAYAESASFIAHLRREPHDARRFNILIARLRAGMTFDKAVRDAYGAGLGYLEREWREELSSSYRTLPIVLGGTAVWLLATVLLFLAFFKRRRQAKRRLAAWAEEERKEEELRVAKLAEAELRMEQVFFEQPASAAPRPRDELPHFVDLGHDRRDNTVPSVEHEGKQHTLH